MDNRMSSLDIFFINKQPEDIFKELSEIADDETKIIYSTARYKNIILCEVNNKHLKNNKVIVNLCKSIKKRGYYFMKLQKKVDKIKKIEKYDSFIEKYVTISKTDFYEILFALFELKEAICRLNEYLYYSNENPFSNNVPYVKYSRFIYESYLNDVYIIQTRFRKLINVLKNEKRFNITEDEKIDIEDKFKVVVEKMRKITKKLRGEHVHDKRYNDMDFFVCDLMERINNISKKIKGKPIKEIECLDLYQNIAVDHLDDVQDMIIENNNYIYDAIGSFLNEISEFIINKIYFYIGENKKE